MKYKVFTNTKKNNNMVSKKINLKSIIGIILMSILISACNSSSNTNHEDEHLHDDHEENMVTLTQNQMDAINLEMAIVEEKNMNLDIQVNGTIELPPQHIADISPIMGGIVKNIFVIEGDRVKKGQVLATLQHPDFIQLQEDYIVNLNTFEIT